MVINQYIYNNYKDRIPYDVFYMKQNGYENYSDHINNILQELKKQGIFWDEQGIFQIDS